MTGFCSNLCSCYTCSPLRTFWGLPPPWDALSPKAPAACLHPCVCAVSLWSNSADPCTAPSLSHLTCCHHAHLFTWETHDLPEGFVPNSHAACDIDVKWWDLIVFPKNLWTEVGFSISANDQTNLKVLPFIVMLELKYCTVCYIRNFFFFFTKFSVHQVSWVPSQTQATLIGEILAPTETTGSRGSNLEKRKDQWSLGSNRSWSKAEAIGMLWCTQGTPVMLHSKKHKNFHFFLRLITDECFLNR